MRLANSQGNQGQVSAADIIALVEKDRQENNRGGYYGLRATDELVEVGGALEVSVNWDMSEVDEDGDYDKEEYKLPGSSAVGLGDYHDVTGLKDAADIESRIKVALEYTASYDHLYLVKGVAMEYGSDEYEVVLSENGGTTGAEVVARLW